MNNFSIFLNLFRKNIITVSIVFLVYLILFVVIFVRYPIYTYEGSHATFRYGITFTDNLIFDKHVKTINSHVKILKGFISEDLDLGGALDKDEFIGEYFKTITTDAFFVEYLNKFYKKHENILKYTTINLDESNKNLLVFSLSKNVINNDFVQNKEIYQEIFQDYIYHNLDINFEKLILSSQQSLTILTEFYDIDKKYDLSNNRNKENLLSLFVEQADEFITLEGKSFLEKKLIENIYDQYLDDKKQDYDDKQRYYVIAELLNLFKIETDEFYNNIKSNIKKLILLQGPYSNINKFNQIDNQRIIFIFIITLVISFLTSIFIILLREFINHRLTK